MVRSPFSKVIASLALAIAVAMGQGLPARGQTPTKPGVIPKVKAKIKSKAEERAKAKAEAEEKTTSKTEPKAGAMLDLNKATAEELEKNLPGVGAVTAKKIVDGRPYTKVDDLAKAGVPARTIDGIRSMVFIGAAPAAKRARATATAKSSAEEMAKAPIDLNSAGLAELEALPGIGPVHAKAIIAGRPYKSVDDLDRVKGLGKARINEIRSLVIATEAASPAPAAVEAKSTKAMERKAARATAKPATKPAATSPLAGGKRININTATKDELDDLPGIGPVKAQAIIDTRPFKAIEDIMKTKGIKEGEFSKIKDMITVE